MAKKRIDKEPSFKIFQFRRVLKNGLQNYWRNIGLSIATTFITTLTLVALSFIVLLNMLLSIALESVESKVDISVFFDPLASQEQMAKTRAEITNIAGVSDVRLVSSEEALNAFKREHLDNQLIISSLDELEENPLQSTLIILADKPEDYENINNVIKQMVDGQVIERVNYDDNRGTIDRLSKLSKWMSTGGLAAGALFAAIAVLVVFNTVRLTIYSRREEVTIMKLVGATNGFVRGPFIIEGILYGVIASLITVSVVLPLLLWVSPKVETFFGTSSVVFDFVLNNLAAVIMFEIGFGILLGIFSSLLAIRRYLQV